MEKEGSTNRGPGDHSTAPLIPSLLLASPGLALLLAAVPACCARPNCPWDSMEGLLGICGLALLACSLVVRRTRMWPKAVALWIGCFAALLLLEGLLRVQNPLAARVWADRIVLPIHQRLIIPNERIPQLDRTIVNTRNELGFRGPPCPQPFDEYCSIVAVGGSTTECQYLSDGKSWPERLMLFLQQRSGLEKIWVNNAGFDGHSTFGHIVLVRDYLSRLKPKYVLLLVGANDVGRDDLSEYDPRPCSTLRALLSHCETFVLVENALRIARAKKGGLWHSALNLEQLPTMEFSQPRFERAERNTDRPSPVTASRLATLLKLCRDPGMEPILVTQPALWGQATDPPTGVDLSRIQLPGLGTCSMEYWKILETYNDVTRRAAKEEGVWIVDLARDMPKDSTYFYDGIHFTNEGAEKVAKL